MTPEEKADARAVRNAAIVEYYQKGNKLAHVASKFKLPRQRVLQILKAEGVWQPYERSNRTAFLGITITEETKAALKEKAEEEGTSVSQLMSDAADELVNR
jgi:hypothetical protein